MAAKIKISNLSSSTTDDTLLQVAAQYGQVLDSIIMRDRDTGASKGFGYATYSSGQDAAAAVAALNGQELDGSRITVVVIASSEPAGTVSGGVSGSYGGYGGGVSGGYGGYGAGSVGGEAGATSW
ncbi:RNA-binding protein [Kitasatospora sp. SUK 42]|uniref:RNA recognition motif domain-containing protein n=1 Tax=Kitasatospora sp. SUK 42 TaxID=1588882 RepID=UPI0018C99B12|nr:RNA-binding protein [Kitasatospora sp. SUK 42]MBV2156489.1 RNA-binding protein [Kitasatospora sp. SUK 42]